MKMLWAAHRSVSAAKLEHGLCNGAVSTLRALISFLQDGGESIVYASNATICRRAENQSDRNLRRHIDQLVAAGLVERRSSPNGKRYLVQHPDGRAIAYGIDLAPLIRRGRDLAATAEEVAAEGRRAHFHRKQLSALLYAAEKQGLEELVARIRPLRRRKVASQVLREACEDLEAALASACAADQHQAPDLPSAPVTADDGQNVRHKIRTESIKKDSDGLDEETEASRSEPALLEKIKSACPEAMRYAARQPESLWEAEELALTLAAWCGIGRDLLSRAIERVGRTSTAVTILGLFERKERIRNLPAYFNTVLIGRKSAGFDPMNLLASAAA